MNKGFVSKLVAILAAGMVVGGDLAEAASGRIAPKESGLRWASGIKCERKGFEAWRNRPDDIVLYSIGRDNWAYTVHALTNLAQKNKGKMLSISLPMLTNDTRAHWAECSRGNYDGYFKTMGSVLQANQLGSSVIRLGWEANGSGFPWNIKGQYDGYKACWRREVQALRSTAPGVRIDWTMKKRTEGPRGAQDIYPGDDVVDIVGLSYYDTVPSWTTQALWDKFANSTYLGGPQGINTWLAFAKQHGKPLGFGEWAVWHQDGGVDNPFFIQKMFEFFGANAPYIAYEGYMNCIDIHSVYPSAMNSKTSAKYQQLWDSSH